jgi:hypothetical protein
MLLCILEFVYSREQHLISDGMVTVLDRGTSIFLLNLHHLKGSSTLTRELA